MSLFHGVTFQFHAYKLVACQVACAPPSPFTSSFFCVKLVVAILEYGTAANQILHISLALCSSAAPSFATLDIPHSAFHSTLTPPHSSLHTSHSSLHIPHSTFHSTIISSHSSLHTPHSLPHIPHSTLTPPHSSLHTPHSTARAGLGLPSIPCGVAWRSGGGAHSARCSRHWVGGSGHCCHALPKPGAHLVLLHLVQRAFLFCIAVRLSLNQVRTLVVNQ